MGLAEAGSAEEPWVAADLVAEVVAWPAEGAAVLVAADEAEGAAEDPSGPC